MSDDDPSTVVFPLIRSQLLDPDGWTVYEALVELIDWEVDEPWVSFLEQLNVAQRAVVSVCQFHEHAAFNGFEAAVRFHGPRFVSMAVAGAGELGRSDVAALLTQALNVGTGTWERLEEHWAQISVEVDAFVERRQADFFINES